MWNEHWKCIGRTHIDRSERSVYNSRRNVNLASRLEAVASKDQIILSPFTKIRVEHEFNLKSIPIERLIKGLKIYQNVMK